MAKGGADASIRNVYGPLFLSFCFSFFLFFFLIKTKGGVEASIRNASAVHLPELPPRVCACLSRMYVRACVRASVRVCVRVWACACVGLTCHEGLGIKTPLTGGKK